MDKLKQLVEFEKIITQTSSRFITLPPDEIHTAINHALAVIGKFAGADRSYIFLLKDNGTMMDCKHEWCYKGIEPQIANLQDLPTAAFPWWMEKMNRLEDIHIPRVADLPVEALAEKDIFQEHNIQSLIGVPLVIGKSLIGFAGFDSVRKEKTWPAEIISLFKIAGDIIISALERERAEQALQESERKFRAVFENAPIGIYRTSPDGRILMANPALIQMMGYSSFEELSKINLEKEGVKRGYPRRQFQELIGQEGELRNLETVWIRPDGIKVHVRENAKAIRAEDGSLLYYEGTIEDITERKRAEKVKESIFRISEAAFSSENLEELYDSIHHIIEGLMPAKNFYIALYDPSTELLSFPYFIDEFDELPLPKKLGRGLTDYVLRTGNPLLATPEVFEDLERKGEVESIGAPSIDWLGVPLKMGGKTIGVLVVQSYTEGIRYGEEEKNILHFVSEQVAMAIHRKQAEQDIHGREQFLSTIIDSIQDGISILDRDLTILRVNRTIEKWYPHALPLVGKKCYQAYHLKNKKCDICPTTKTLTTGKAAQEVVPLTGPEGEIRGWLDLYSFPLLDPMTGQMKGVIEYVHDITEKKQAQEAAEASLREKEVLLREIHHRVKNNMQVISSLLNLQARHIKDAQILEMFQESQRRIRSMALVHERLYQSTDLSLIEFAEYLRTLVVHLFHTYKVNSSLIRLTTDTEEVRLNINTAIPCGLIVNELVSNALKHAFPGGRAGEVEISLHRHGGDGYVLRVRDDGVGFPEALDFRRTNTLGMQIVVTLADQIEGKVELLRDKGTEFQIYFKELASKHRE